MPIRASTERELVGREEAKSSYKKNSENAHENRRDGSRPRVQQPRDKQEMGWSRRHDRDRITRRHSCDAPLQTSDESYGVQSQSNQSPFERQIRPTKTIE